MERKEKGARLVLVDLPSTEDSSNEKKKNC